MNNIQQSYPWLQQSYSQLTNYIEQNRIPQALLIVGKKGLGKDQLAKAFAQSLLCSQAQNDSTFCGKCQSCTLFSAQTHPDYFYLQPEEQGKVIGIDVIRQLTVKLSLKPQFDTHRIIIINPADRLNNASANAFLKYLEEPTERTSIVLITESPFKLPATIKSRCQKIELAAPDRAVAKTWLQQQGVAEKCDLLLNLSQGSPLLAKQFSESSLLKYRAECFNQWCKLASSDESFVEIAEHWQKLDKETINLLLSWLVSWVMDMIKLRHQQQTNSVVNQDLITDLQELAKRLDLKALFKHYDLLLLSWQRFDTQLNKQLLFEEILSQTPKRSCK